MHLLTDYQIESYIRYHVRRLREYNTPAALKTVYEELDKLQEECKKRDINYEKITYTS